MKLPFIPSCRRPRFRSGFTLIELIISMTLGLVMLGLVVATTITLTHSMAAITNYFELDCDSRYTLDIMSRDIRNASTVTSFATNSLAMSGSDYQGNAISFTYTWNGSNVLRSYYTNGVLADSLLVLSNCDYLCFSNYTRVPNTNFTFFPASGTNDPKLISVSWRCSRSVLGRKINTESVQTAKIVIRN